MDGGRRRRLASGGVAARRLVLMLAAAATLGFAAPLGAREALGAGDSIRITVFQNPDLTTEARISERGTIVFPLLGEVPVAGQTAAEAGARIAERLRQGRLIKDPQVNVSVLEVRSRQVSVLGHVGRPGRYPLDAASARLTDILALAGGIAQGGDDTVVVIGTRDGKVARTEVDLPALYRSGDLSRNVELQAGDLVYVRPAPMFYIYGEVQRAGAYRVEPGMTVMGALSLGGGLTPRGTVRGLKIHRRNADGAVRTLQVSPTDAVEANDVIYVRESLF
jgi:polysaccharide export outer membrane protein